MWFVKGINLLIYSIYFDFDFIWFVPFDLQWEYDKFLSFSPLLLFPFMPPVLCFSPFYGDFLFSSALSLTQKKTSKTAEKRLRRMFGGSAGGGGAGGGGRGGKTGRGTRAASLQLVQSASTNFHCIGKSI